jgi:hypothetical protein
MRATAHSTESALKEICINKSAAEAHREGEYESYH